MWKTDAWVTAGLQSVPRITGSMRNTCKSQPTMKPSQSPQPRFYCQHDSQGSERTYSENEIGNGRWAAAILMFCEMNSIICSAHQGYLNIFNLHPKAVRHPDHPRPDVYQHSSDPHSVHTPPSLGPPSRLPSAVYTAPLVFSHACP
jgi:hypothetical protein